MLKKVSVSPHSIVPGVTAETLNTYSWRYPEEMPCSITITLKSGDESKIEKKDYEGFFRRPMAWERVVEKFERLSAPFADGPLRHDLIEAVSNLESIRVADLMQLLGRV